jgi:hypothetical protein
MMLRLFIAKNQKYEREGRLEVIFYGGNSYTIVLRQMKFGTVNDHGHTYEFYFNCFYFKKKVFKYGDFAKF